ncbi:hypothetical protein TSAR_003452, partial [Trichomalopsis sarcophagae]
YIYIYTRITAHSQLAPVNTSVYVVYTTKKADIIFFFPLKLFPNNNK